MTVGLSREDDAGSVGLSPRGHPVVGAQRLGPYRLIQPLGEGGMGVVHLALDPYGRAVAIKVLREHIAHDRQARDRLRREVETLALVQDARVAAVLDADTEGPRPYIVTRYIPGPALDQVVSENGPLLGEDLLRLGRGLWDALNAIHAAGVIHRDLKPANVVLLDGDPVVIDFGIAHVADDIRLTMTGLVMGTPGYLSPEVVEGAPVTEATDWWGWAATLAYAASGTAPFGRGPMDVVLDRVRRGQADLSGVDRRLAPLLAAALSPDPSRRPRADEVLQALDRYAVGASATLALPVPGSSPSGPYPGMPQARGWDRPQRATAEQDWLTAWQHDGMPEGRPGPADESQQEADSGSEPGQPDPRVGGPSRAGTMLALLVGVLGVAASWPAVAIGLVAGWCLLAHFTDRSITAVVRRRFERGRRRGDVPIALVFSPWHAIVSLLTTVLALVFPAIVAIGTTFAVALALAAVGGADPQPDRSAPLVAGASLGLLMCWWGPGGARLQRGSRSLVRAVSPGRGSTRFLVVALLLLGAGLGVAAWGRHGQPDWWPASLEQLKSIAQLLG